MGWENVGFEVITAVVIKSSSFWDITPCSPLKVNRHFGGTCRLHLQGGRIRQARNQRDFQRTTLGFIPEESTLRDGRIFMNDECPLCVYFVLVLS
jgi:hypothetical protein